jgi:hypothetical protein
MFNSDTIFFPKYFSSIIESTDMEGLESNKDLTKVIKGKPPSGKSFF